MVNKKYKMKKSKTIQLILITAALAGCQEKKKEPEWGSGNKTQAARQIKDARYVAINDTRPLGHLSGAGATAPENDVQNREIAAFLDSLGKDGRKAP